MTTQIETTNQRLAVISLLEQYRSLRNSQREITVHMERITEKLLPYHPWKVGDRIIHTSGDRAWVVERVGVTVVTPYSVEDGDVRVRFSATLSPVLKNGKVGIRGRRHNTDVSAGWRKVDG